jgi:plastocyanin
MTRFHFQCVTLTALALTTACSDDPVSQNARASAVSAPEGASLSSNRGNGNEGNGVGNGGAKRYIAVKDDCDPNDPAWAPTGGCLLKGGDVTNAEFTAFLTSPLSTATVGHPAWRNEPSYVKIEVGETVRVTNEGGRLHTFTRVANYGGGRVPPLNVGLTQAPECLAAAASEIPPGATLQVAGMTVGTAKYQCCIHPWMRAAIKVLPDQRGHSKS